MLTSNTAPGWDGISRKQAPLPVLYDGTDRAARCAHQPGRSHLLRAVAGWVLAWWGGPCCRWPSTRSRCAASWWSCVSACAIGHGHHCGLVCAAAHRRRRLVDPAPATLAGRSWRRRCRPAMTRAGDDGPWLVVAPLVDHDLCAIGWHPLLRIWPDATFAPWRAAALPRRAHWCRAPDSLVWGRVADKEKAKQIAAPCVARRERGWGEGKRRGHDGSLTAASSPISPPATPIAHPRSAHRAGRTPPRRPRRQRARRRCWPGNGSRSPTG